MARYTETLRNLMRDEATMSAITEALSTYPIYESNNALLVDLIPTREKLNEKLLNHYKYREIGFDTVGEFLDRLEITMNEIMPRYNELYKTVEAMSELPSPFDNVDVKEIYSETRTREGYTKDTGTTLDGGTVSDSGSVTSSASDETETTSSVVSKSKNVMSDMPQGNISVPATDIDSITRAKEVTWNKNESENKGETSGSSSTSTTNTNTSTRNLTTSRNDETTSEGTETIEHTFTKVGNQGVNTYAHDMNEFRTSIIDVTMQIINDREISDLFMKVY